MNRALCQVVNIKLSKIYGPPPPGTHGLVGEQRGEGMRSLLQAVKEVSSGAKEAHAKDTFS